MSWRRYSLIVWKELRQFRRDRLLLPLVFLMPVLQLILFGYVVAADVTNLPTALIDYDHTATSRSIARSFASSDYFRIIARPSSETQLQPLLDATTVQVAIVIPEGAEASLSRGEKVPVGIIVDGADSRTASVASGYAAQIIGRVNQKRVDERIGSLQTPWIDARVRVVFNPSMKAVNAMIPGLIATILMISIMSIMSQSVVRERARGTLEQMMVTPITRGEYLLGKVTPYVGIAILQMAFVALIGRAWFRVPFNGNLVTVVLGLTLFMLTSLGLGLLISLVSRTQHQAQQMVMFYMIPTMVLSGFMFPIESMPPEIVPLTYIIPLRYALVVLRAAFLKGAGLVDLVVPMGALTVFAIIVFGIAVTRFSKRLSD